MAGSSGDAGRSDLTSEQRCAWGDGNQEQGHGGDACKEDGQAAGQDVIVAHRLAFVVLAISPFCFVDGQMGTNVLDEHC